MHRSISALPVARFSRAQHGQFEASARCVRVNRVNARRDVNRDRVPGRRSTCQVDASDHTSCPPPPAPCARTLRGEGVGEAGRPSRSRRKRNKDDRGLQDARGHGRPVGKWLTGATAPVKRHWRDSILPPDGKSQSSARCLKWQRLESH